MDPDCRTEALTMWAGLPLYVLSGICWQKDFPAGAQSLLYDDGFTKKIHSVCVKLLFAAVGLVTKSIKLFSIPPVAPEVWAVRGC